MRRPRACAGVQAVERTRPSERLARPPGQGVRRGSSHRHALRQSVRLCGYVGTHMQSSLRLALVGASSGVRTVNLSVAGVAPPADPATRTWHGGEGGSRRGDPCRPAVALVPSQRAGRVTLRRTRDVATSHLPAWSVSTEFVPTPCGVASACHGGVTEAERPATAAQTITGPLCVGVSSTRGGSCRRLGFMRSSATDPPRAASREHELVQRVQRPTCAPERA